MRKLILTLTVSILIVYLSMSFVEMSINPVGWHLITRIVCVAGVVALLIAFYNRIKISNGREEN